MIKSIYFWKSWPAGNQRIFWLFASSAFLALAFLWVSDFRTPYDVIPVQRSQEVGSTSFNTHTFRLGAFEIPVPADAYILFERTSGGLLAPNTQGSVIFLVFLVAGIAGILTVVTTLSRFWYYVGSGFFLLIIVSLRMETLLLFGIPNVLPAALVLLVSLAPVVYFGLVKTSAPFSVRLFTNVLVFALIAVGIHFFADVINPFQQLAANALVPATILSIIFILCVAHEILAALLSVIGYGMKQRNSLVNFLVISGIYLINLGILYANRKHILQWHIPEVNLMIFVTISGILGLWGFRQRESQFEGIFRSNPEGTIIFLCLATIGFGTFGFFFATANDPIIKLMEDTILYSHIGYGIIFVIYIVNNFGAMMSKNIQVSKILYRPGNMPYFTFRLAGLICTFIFFAYSSWKVSFHQVHAGYYNAWGDTYINRDTLNLAQGYYQRSLFYSIRNYHANYALAQLYHAQGETDKEKKQYQLLANSRPLDLGYLNLARLEEEQNYNLEPVVSVLRAGLRDFPRSGRLMNELSVIYASQNERDSAMRYASAGIKSFGTREQSTTNWIGMQAQFRTSLSADSLFSAAGDYPGVKTNALALASVQGTRLAVTAEPGTDTLLTVPPVTAVHNYLLNQGDKADTALVSRAVALTKKHIHPYLRDFLLSGTAYARYASGETSSAIRLLREAAYAGQQEKYFQTLGLWSLEQDASANALNYFDQALKQEYKPAFFYKAIALTQELRLDEARVCWDSLGKSKDAAEKIVATKMSRVLATTNETISSLSDEEKYIFSAYRIPLSDITGFENIVNAIVSPEWKAKALLDRSKKFDKLADADLAYAVFEPLNELAQHDAGLYEQIIHQKLLYLAQQKKWNELSRALDNKNLFKGKYKIHKIFFDALMAEQAGKKETATKNFRWLLNANPFFEDGVVAAVKYLSRYEPDTLKMYSSVVSALDFNPNSIKLLKVYAIMSLKLDFDDAGQSTLDRLKASMSHDSFLAFLKENPDLFEVTAH